MFVHTEWFSDIQTKCNVRHREAE
uniref:Uncharacterized protein n=1 Tax=Anguilla anguilla TaxID=7936 RepID=A0A0E9UXR2_ANGAN